MGKARLGTDTVDKIRYLRTQGKSLPEISNALSISRTSVFRHISGVEILPEFLSEWAGKRGGSRQKKLKLEQKAFEEGKKVVKNLSLNEKRLFLSALYWAEGSKKDFGLSNTDPELIKVFVSGLREVFCVTEDRLRVSIRIYEDLDKDECLNFWSEVVKIPKERFLKVDVLHGKKVGKLKYGMCRVRVARGADLLRTIVGINKAFVLSAVLAS